jgi:DNA helicase HerA-like ATPase
MSRDDRPPYPFDDNRYIGTVTQVAPSSLKVNLPSAGSPSAGVHHGNRVAGGEVGEFVLIECDELGIFGRILDIRLPERERLAVEPTLGRQPEVHPVGSIQMLSTISLGDFTVTSGISRYPRLGSKVFSAHPSFIRWLISQPRHVTDSERKLVLQFACLPSAQDAEISLTPEQVFGRHCAILGTTGGGKSWTLSRMIEETLKHQSKVLLLDATGEFWRIRSESTTHVTLGDGIKRPKSSELVCHPHHHMYESDLFAVFRPSGQSQGPKMREAIRSLKLARLMPDLADDEGVLVKANQRRQPFEDGFKRLAGNIDTLFAEFDIKCLSRQVIEECIWPTARNNPAQFGDYSNEDTYCLSLQMRIENIIRSTEFRCIFDPPASRSIYEVMEEFLEDDSKRLLRVSLQNVPFANNVREIVANAIGRHLLDMARDGQFRERPLVVILDEAHQFLNRSIGEESLRVELDSFGMIAKEGRKFALTICIATQRPRDIPQDVLSQMGTLIVHRLINERDREVVEKAAGDIDRSAAEFLPTLAPGEAIVIGVDVPVPMSLKIDQPKYRPDSSGPDYQTHWSVPEEDDTEE